MTAFSSTPLQISDFDYTLPKDRIAKYPLVNRDDSRMLVVDRQAGTLAHHGFKDLPHFLAAGDALVLNNARVLPASFYGHRQGLTGRVGFLLLHAVEGNPLHWRALMKPAKKLPPGTVVCFAETNATMTVLSYEGEGYGVVAVDPAEHGSVEALMEAVGEMPLPPYLERPPETADKETYQTVFSKVPGAQAAPTAGLHFTPAVLDTLSQQGVQLAEVTLAVGAGTFRPVLVENVTEHRMDPEFYTLSPETSEILTQTKASGRRLVAVGTTALKTLETVAQKFEGRLATDSGWSELFIYPGFQFQAVDALLTNFHLPRSTLLMLVSAFAGHELMLRAYQEAVAERYRFYSYGDCMLIV